MSDVRKTAEKMGIIRDMIRDLKEVATDERKLFRELSQVVADRAHIEDLQDQLHVARVQRDEARYDVDRLVAKLNDLKKVLGQP